MFAHGLSIGQRLAGGKRRPSLLFAALLLLTGASAAAATAPASLRIAQAFAAGTEVTAYVAVRDAGDAPVVGLPAERLSATLGAQVAEVTETTPFATTGEGVLYLFLVDVSRSLDDARFARVRAAIDDWIAALGPNDRAALLSFGERVQTLVPPTANRAVLRAALATLAPTDARTALHQALASGLTLGRQRGPDWPARRVLVILSDGLDDAPGGMTAEEVEAQLAEDAVPIHAIGFGAVRDRARREAGLAALGRFARRSGGVFVDASGDALQPEAAYAAMRARIQAVERVRLRCPACVADGNRYRLRLALTQDGLTLSDGVDVRLYPAPAAAPVAEPPAPDPAPEPVPAAPDPVPDPAPPSPAAATPDPAPIPTPAAPAWTYLAVGGGLLVLALPWLFWLRKRRRQTAGDAAAPLPPTVSSAPPDAASPDEALSLTMVRPQSASSGPWLRLHIMNGPRRGTQLRLTLNPLLLIGRAAGCTLALPEDDEVSARHACLTLHGGRLILEDLDSTNGTLLNGVPLKAPHPVSIGDVARIGQTALRIGEIE